MTEKCDEKDDGDGDTEQQEQNGTHWELSDFKTLIISGSTAGLDLNGHDAVPLPSADGGGKARTEGTDQQCQESPEQSVSNRLTRSLGMLLGVGEDVRDALVRL